MHVGRGKIRNKCTAGFGEGAKSKIELQIGLGKSRGREIGRGDHWGNSQNGLGTTHNKFKEDALATSENIE